MRGLRAPGDLIMSARPLKAMNSLLIMRSPNSSPALRQSAASMPMIQANGAKKDAE